VETSGRPTKLHVARRNANIAFICMSSKVELNDNLLLFDCIFSIYADKPVQFFVYQLRGEIGDVIMNCKYLLISVQYSTLEYSTVQYSTVQYSTVH